LESDRPAIQALLSSACQSSYEITTACGVIKVTRLAKKGEFSCVQMVTVRMPKVPKGFIYDVATDPSTQYILAIAVSTGLWSASSLLRRG
jgi:hypothetical protein